MHTPRERLYIRPEKESDLKGIRELNEQVFAKPEEALLAEKLRLEPAFIRDFSLVARTDGIVTGYLLLFPVNIVQGDHHRPVLSLAPLAVHPEYRNRGIGRRLLEDGLGRALEAGFGAVLAIGKSTLYERFGFRRASRWGITSPLDLADDSFLALELIEHALDGMQGRVSYSSVFNNAI